MYGARQPWYRTKWGIVVALLLSPLWYVWKKTRRSRLTRTVTGVAIALLLFVGLVYIGSRPSSSTPPAQTESGGTKPPTSVSSTVLTGYGATQAAWNANHNEDDSFAANTVYDPASNLGNGYSDKYVGVLWTAGRALSYQIGFPSGTSIATAESAAMQEFPNDAHILWAELNDSDRVNVCYQMEVHSATLAAVLGTDGDVFVEFQTITGNDTSSSIGYYASNVNNAILRNSDYKMADAVGGC